MYNNQQNQQNQSQLFEGLEYGDLRRLVHPKLHIDEFKSKMGDDADVIVLSFKVKEKQPSEDFEAFIERGYEWVLDADFGSGDFEDGEFLVFVEMDRTPHAATHIIKLLTDIMNLTGQDLEDWKFQYSKDKKEYPISIENLRRIVPMTSEIYQSKFGDDDAVEKSITQMQETARVKITKTAAKNSYTESLKAAAGIK